MEPFQEKVPHHPNMSAKEFLLVTKEVESMLQKGAIQKNISKKISILEQPAFSRKKGYEEQTCDKLKNLNASIAYLHFKMEGLHLLRGMLKEKDYLRK